MNLSTKMKQSHTIELILSYGKKEKNSHPKNNYIIIDG